MKQKGKYAARILASIVCPLLLLLLAACSGGASAPTSDATPTPKQMPTPGPTPTPNPAVAQTLTGDGYTIGYPQGWTENKQSMLALVANLNTGTTLTIVTITDDGSSINQVLEQELQSLDQAMEHVRKGQTTSTTIGGESWKQQEYSAVMVGQQVKGETLAGKHGGKIFSIDFVITADQYDSVTAQYIQPMLQSFKFTS